MEFVHNQLVDQIETLKQSLKMAEKTAINNESSAKENLSKASATDANENSNSTDNYFKDALTGNDESKTTKEVCEKPEDTNKDSVNEIQRLKKELEGLKTKNETLEEKKIFNENHSGNIQKKKNGDI
mgnify:CR=1 FL=1